MTLEQVVVRSRGSSYKAGLLYLAERSLTTKKMPFCSRFLYARPFALSSSVRPISNQIGYTVWWTTPAWSVSQYRGIITILCSFMVVFSGNFIIFELSAEWSVLFGKSRPFGVKTSIKAGQCKGKQAVFGVIWGAWCI